MTNKTLESIKLSNSENGLSEAVADLEIQLEQNQLDQLDRYCRLLWDWNERINLTRHTDYETFVRRDLVDSMQLGDLLHENETVLDVGTGGGVPGVILAILRPDLTVSLSESVIKKARAIEQIVQELELPVTVFAQRAEAVLDDFRFDVLVARAVGSLRKMLYWFQPHWDSIGRLLTVKGPKWVDERSEARHRGLLRGMELRCATRYPMPGTTSESVVLKIWRKGDPER